MPKQAPPYISDAQWRAVEKTLPSAADPKSVRNRLEQIARNKLSPKQLAFEQEELARACDDLTRHLLKTNPDEAQTEFFQEITRRSDSAKKQAQAYRRIKRSRFLRQTELLWLWQSIGGDLGYRTASRKPRGMVAWPAPRASVIPFFQAAWKAIAGKTLSAKQIRDIVIDYQHLNFSAAGMRGDSGLGVNAEVVKAT
jgi:hypothetical protein